MQMAVYGDVRRDGLECACRTVRDMEAEVRRFMRSDNAPPGCYSEKT
jgi:hypothetical protein